MIKHIGRHGEKKIVIVRRTVPKEETNALIVYSESLPQTFHDTLMKALESDAGQQTLSLDDVLFRTVADDGRNLLTALHSEGFIKKVPTIQIIVTPTGKDRIRLDELNKLLDKIADGKTAEITKIAESQGFRDPGKMSDVTPKTVEEQIAELTAAATQLMDTAKSLQAQLKPNADAAQKTTQV